jgi:5-methylcytosine-specific restriction endonuclease McrA
MLVRVCATPGCGVVTQRTHCAEHEHARYSRSAWQRVRADALRAARHRCQRCGSRDALVVHHRGPSAAPTLVVVLCRRCHVDEHAIDHGRRPGDARVGGRGTTGVGGHR